MENVERSLLATTCSWRQAMRLSDTLEEINESLWSVRVSKPKRREVKTPPSAVLKAFGLSEDLVRLPGGQGQAFRSGDVILKPATNDERTRWISEFCLETTLEEFRLPQPVRTGDGDVVFNEWQAWEVMPGEHRSGNWEEVVELCSCFHRAIADCAKPDWVDRLKNEDPWILADRAVWGELEVTLHPRIAPAVTQLRGCLSDISTPSQLIHGDFGGNVLFHPVLPPGIIDLSPSWRPAGFAVGVVIADAIVWGDADMSLIECGCAIEDFDQLLLRAELRRILELNLAHQLWKWDTLDEIEAHQPLIDTLVARHSSG